jgi:hypothetical protein
MPERQKLQVEAVHELAEKPAKDPLERWPDGDQFRIVAYALLFSLFVIVVSAAACFTPYLMFEQESCVDSDGKDARAGVACQLSTLKIQLGLFFTRVSSDVEVLNRNNLFINDGLGRDLQLCFDPEIDAKGYNIVFSVEVKAMCTRVRDNAKATAALVVTNLAFLSFGAVYLNVGLRPPGLRDPGSGGDKPKEPEAAPGDHYYRSLRRAFNISRVFTFLATLAAFGASVLWSTRDAFNFKSPSLDGFRNLTLADFKATLLDDLGPGWPLEVITFFLCVVCSVRVHVLHKTCKKILAMPVPTLVKPAGTSTNRVAPAPFLNDGSSSRTSKIVHVAPGQFTSSDTRRGTRRGTSGQNAAARAPAQLGRGPPPKPAAREPSWADLIG